MEWGEDLRKKLDSNFNEWQELLTVVLKNHDFVAINFLRTCVANVCNVKEEELLEARSDKMVSQARWFYWLALRRLLCEPYEKIATTSLFDGHRFNTQSIINSVNHMAKIVNTNVEWNRKWCVVRAIIKEMNEMKKEEKE